MTGAVPDLVAALSALVAKDDDEPLETRRDVLRAIPVPLRAALAAVALAASDSPVNGVSVASAAGFSRGTAYRHNKAELDVIISSAPMLVSALLCGQLEGPSVLELERQLQQRDATIAELRASLRQAESDRNQALAYARDLHQQLAPEYEAVVKEKSDKVRHLRTVDWSGDTDPGD